MQKPKVDFSIPVKNDQEISILNELHYVRSYPFRYRKLAQHVLNLPHQNMLILSINSIKIVLQLTRDRPAIQMVTTKEFTFTWCVSKCDNEDPRDVFIQNVRRELILVDHTCYISCLPKR